MYERQPRPITQELLDEFVYWTQEDLMFKKSLEGKAFGEELRAVFYLAMKALEDEKNIY